MLPAIFGENVFDNFMNDFDRDFFRRWDASKLMRTDVKETEGGYAGVEEGRCKYQA